MTDAQVVVLKFGSSVLESERDLPTAVLEIYRELREGRRVVAVVSAFASETDRLLARVARHFDRPRGPSLARYLATGEVRAAACLGMALDDAGVPNVVFDPDDVTLTTRGPTLDADPHDLDVAKVRDVLCEGSVVVLGGFAGRGADGLPSLLGRGGSDLTALFVAERLGAHTCRLVKDVDGVYSEDPQRRGTRARKYRRASWETVAGQGGGLVQPKAVQFARDHDRGFLVTGALMGPGTVVGSGPSAYDGDQSPRQPLRVALAGLGTVGLGVYRWLQHRRQQFEIVRILVRDLGKSRPADVPSAILTDDPDGLFAEQPDVLVELIGGTHDAGRIVARALDAGLDVVTANKALIASTPAYLRRRSPQHDRLRFSASVGGAVPVLEGISTLASRFEIEHVEGVLNGTCNYVLDRLAEGCRLADAVAEAQANGFAERDPTLDLSGRDSADKLAIVAAEAFGVAIHPDDIPCEGIGRVEAASVRRSRRGGAVVRLLAEATRSPDGWRGRVAPAALAADHPLAALRNEDNGVVIRTRCGRSLVLRGKGAGRWPTTLAVVADLVDVWRRAAQSPRGIETPLAPRRVTSTVPAHTTNRRHSRGPGPAACPAEATGRAP